MNNFTIFNININSCSPCSQYKRQILITLITSLGFFGVGNIVGWSSTGLPSLVESQDFQNLSIAQKSWIASLVPLGAVISTPLAGIGLDHMGRKTTILISAVIQILGWLIMLSATHVSMLYIGRFITGLSVGALSMAIPVYISDIADSEIRGSLCVFIQIVTCTGIFFSFLFGSIISWKSLVLLSTIPGIILLGFSGFLLESQRYYLYKGRTDDALNVTRYLRENKSDAEVDEEMLTITKNLEEIQNTNISSGDLYSQHILIPLLSSCLLMIIQQLSGINVILFYSVYIFESAGTNIDPHLGSVLVALILIILTAMTTLLIDVAGRRILLLTSGITVTITHSILGIFFALHSSGSEISPYLSWIPTTILLVYIVGFGIGFGPIPMVIMSEILPNHVIGLASALTICCHFGMAFLVVFSFQEFVDDFGISVVFLFFSFMSSLGTLFIYLAIPETKLKTLEEIQMHYGIKNPILKQDLVYHTFQNPTAKSTT